MILIRRANSHATKPQSFATFHTHFSCHTPRDKREENKLQIAKAICPHSAPYPCKHSMQRLLKTSPLLANFNSPESSFSKLKLHPKILLKSPREVVQPSQEKQPRKKA